MRDGQWSYPGSRWWKFDFHTHTPASRDTPWRRKPLPLSEEEWLLRYMAAGIDCVAVTDHNSGDWIDRLKSAYERMKKQADAGQPPEGFREMTIFPGVEISAGGGVHVLAVFDPAATASDIDRLLGAVGYSGAKGGSDAETIQSVAQVIAEALKAGAIPIPAHADQEKGLLRVNPKTRECALSASMVKQALEAEGLLAVEWCDLSNPYPQAVERLVQPLARVLGSDCHSFQGQKVPGSHYTWVKMAKPTLEGLRLALLDGNGVSVRRSEEGPFDPFRTPAHVIRAIEIDKARVMGNGGPARLELSPYFNAIVGGRGTGKSTVAHALRLAARREAELQALPKDSEPRKRFESFREVSRGRDGEGALKPDTAIRVEWQREGRHLRLNWRAPGSASQSLQGSVEEWEDDRWQPSASQSVNANRFPVRLFSQGQIAAMAHGGRQALLAIVDEAAGVEALKESYEEARRAFFAQRARLREIEGKLNALPEVERRLQEAEGTLKALAQGDYAGVQQAFARAQRQTDAVDKLLEQLGESVTALRETAERLLLDDWLPQHFGEDNADLLDWRKNADDLLARTRQQLEQEAAALEQGMAELNADERLNAWRDRAEAARQAHRNLQERLAAQGVDNPQAFERLTQERRQLDAQLKALRQLNEDRATLVRQIEKQQALARARRQAITERRQAFLQEKLAQNDHVRIQVAPFGFDPEVIERSLRDLLDVTDERFAADILESIDGQPNVDGQRRKGLAVELAQAEGEEKLKALDSARQRLLEPDAKFHGKFRSYLAKRWEKPELADHALAWFPEDDLRIEYQRDGRWLNISEGSQGQRAAALLAFLLAFGEEPIVLDQPEDDLDNRVIYDLIVRQIRENKLRRQLIVITHNPNIVINGDAELVHVMAFGRGQCHVKQSGALQEKAVREEVCRVMEGGREAFARRWKRLGKEA